MPSIGTTNSDTGLQGASETLRRIQNWLFANSETSSPSSCTFDRQRNTSWNPTRLEDFASNSHSSSTTRRTSTASSGAECSPPDLNHKEVPKIYQIECQKICQIHMPERMSEDLPDRISGGRRRKTEGLKNFIKVVLSSSSLPKSFARKMSEYMPYKMPEKMSEYMSDRMCWWGSLEVSNSWF